MPSKSFGTPKASNIKHIATMTGRMEVVSASGKSTFVEVQFRVYPQGSGTTIGDSKKINNIVEYMIDDTMQVNLSDCVLTSNIIEEGVDEEDEALREMREAKEAKLNKGKVASKNVASTSSAPAKPNWMNQAK